MTTENDIAGLVEAGIKRARGYFSYIRSLRIQRREHNLYSQINLWFIHKTRYRNTKEVLVIVHASIMLILLLGLERHQYSIANFITDSVSRYFNIFVSPYAVVLFFGAMATYCLFKREDPAHYLLGALPLPFFAVANLILSFTSISPISNLLSGMSFMMLTWQGIVMASQAANIQIMERTQEDFKTRLEQAEAQVEKLNAVIPQQNQNE